MVKPVSARTIKKVEKIKIVFVLNLLIKKENLVKTKKNTLFFLKYLL